MPGQRSDDRASRTRAEQKVGRRAGRLVLPGTLGVVVAIPVSANDASGVPPCNGAPGSAGNISMHAWHS